MYIKDGSIRIAFMEVAVCFENSSKSFLVIRPVNLLSTGDSMLLNSRIFRCTNILYGTCRGTALEIIDRESIIQKLAFRREVNVNFPSIPDSMFSFNILTEVKIHNATSLIFSFFIITNIYNHQRL